MKAVAAAPLLGVLGGGQLGRMFVHAAQAHGFRVAVLDPGAASPAGAAADVQLSADYSDPDALNRLAGTCAAVTTEFENVPAASLRRLADSLPVAPPADAVEICQNRAREKRCLAAAGVPCAPYAEVNSPPDAAQASHAALLPGILKTSSLGYDGKGQIAVAAARDLPQAFATLGGVPSFSGATPVCAWNYTPYDNLVEREDRFQLYGELNWDITDDHRFHFEAMLVNDLVAGQDFGRNWVRSAKRLQRPLNSSCQMLP